MDDAKNTETMALDPCACGNRDIEMLYWQLQDEHQAKCGLCGRMSAWRPTREGAVTEWNADRRAQPAANAGAVEALVEAAGEVVYEVTHMHSPNPHLPDERFYYGVNVKKEPVERLRAAIAAYLARNTENA